MSRPVKCRRVCYYPRTVLFAPDESYTDEDAIILTIDEYETIRLIDKEGYGQEKCAMFMQISRTTAQRIYECQKHKGGDVCGSSIFGTWNSFLGVSLYRIGLAFLLAGSYRCDTRRIRPQES